jgi:hypothetical protein
MLDAISLGDGPNVTLEATDSLGEAEFFITPV